MYRKLLSSILFVLSTTLFAHGQSFTVTTQNDTPDVNVADGVCADELGNCSLRLL